jgi:hypothetical protein
MFTASDYKTISDIVFSKEEPYPGYRREIIESPNGDGKWDEDKRYAHVAKKYQERYENPFKKGTLNDFLNTAHEKAVEIAIELGVPRDFWPDRQDSTLRILEYAPGAITHPHLDFNLFTLMCYRNIPEDFRYAQSEADSSHPGIVRANRMNEQIHFGEILELIIPDYKATPHEVIVDPWGRSQYSIVYFSIPDHKLTLPNGTTVGAFIEERMGRSRKEAA